MNYEDACDRIMTLMDGLSWIKAAPADPPAAPAQFPFAALFPQEGTSTLAADVKQDLHTVALEIHWALRDMPRQVGDAKDRLDDVLNELHNDPTLNGTVDTIVSPITYEFGPMEYGALKTLGFIFHITFKQRTAVS